MREDKGIFSSHLPTWLIIKDILWAKDILKAAFHLLHISSNHLQHHITYESHIQKFIIKHQWMTGAINAVQNICPLYISKVWNVS
jgi:hypothetical protein